VNVTQLTDLFKSYMDEADDTFVNAANVQRYLTIGYDRFRGLVTRQEPFAYVRSVQFTPGAASYDLAAGAVKVLGSTPNATRMVRLLALAFQDPTTGVLIDLYTPLGSFDEFVQYPPGDSVYFKENTTLLFPGVVNRLLTLYYHPASTVDWTKSAPADTEFIDDFAEFHDLIALLAYGQYAIRDGGKNDVLQSELKDRTREFQAYISTGTDIGSARILLTR
jgi:hypothetical protein